MLPSQTYRQPPHNYEAEQALLGTGRVGVGRVPLRAAHGAQQHGGAHPRDQDRASVDDQLPVQEGEGGAHQPRRRRRRAASDGVRARSRRGTIGESWWSRRFLAVLESLTIANRLSRGRMRGAVLAFSALSGLALVSLFMGQGGDWVSPRDSKVAFVAGDRHVDGNLPLWSILRNITITLLPDLTRFGLVRGRQEEAVGVNNRLFRLRRLVVQPGGVVPWHSHGNRPAARV